MKSLTMLLAFVSGLFMRAIGGKREAGQRFWSFRAAADEGAAELLLYGPISDTTWWGDEVTPALFAQDLAALGDVQAITVRIYSYGGDPFAAWAIRGMLDAHPAQLTVRVDGAAASAATLIAPKRAKVIMPSNSAMLVHHPRATGFIFMNAQEMRDYATELDAMSAQFVNGYAERTGMAADDIHALMTEDRWMYAPEAVEKGFADELLSERMAASVQGTQLMINGVGQELAEFDGLNVEAIADEEAPAPEPAPDPAANLAALFPFAIAGGRELIIGEQRFVFTAETLSEHFTALVDEIRTAAREEGIQAERGRMLKLDGIRGEGAREIVATAKSAGTSYAEVCEQLVEAGQQNQAGLDFLHRRAADAHVSGANVVAAGVAPEGGGEDEAARVAAMAKQNSEEGRI